MHIQMTEETRKRLLSLITEKKVSIQLVYDSEGCGCAVSGVPTLWLIEPQSAANMENAGDDELPIYYEPRHAVFFEPSMKLVYNEGRNSYKLSSNQQIYHMNMTVIDRRDKIAL